MNFTSENCPTSNNILDALYSYTVDPDRTHLTLTHQKPSTADMHTNA